MYVPCQVLFIWLRNIRNDDMNMKDTWVVVDVRDNEKYINSFELADSIPAFTSKVAALQYIFDYDEDGTFKMIRLESTDGLETKLRDADTLNKDCIEYLRKHNRSIEDIVIQF